MNKSTIIELSDIESKLKTFQSPPSRSKPVSPDPLESPFVEAAAVLVFYDPDTIKISGRYKINKDEWKKGITELIGNSELVYGSNSAADESSILTENKSSADPADKKVNYLLSDPVRKAMLQKLTAEHRLEEAIHANEIPGMGETHLLQRIFTKALRKELPPVKKLTLRELNALHRVSEWLEGTNIPLPSSEQVTRSIEMMEMLAPFRHLTGKYINGEFVEHFRGRKNELATLRKYAGVAPPGSMAESISRFVRDFIEPVMSWDKKPPLLIFGIGGVGKSTLVAKFLLDHAEAHLSDRFPFVYLDFDKPSLNPFEPETLLIEAARQLAIQYIDTHLYKHFRFFQAYWNEKLTSSSVTSNTSTVYLNDNKQSVTIKQNRDQVRTEFVRLVKELSTVEEKPFLIVIDTFEEVQYKGQECVKKLYDYLQELQKEYPLLRVVVAGRAPVTDLKTQELELGGLDPEAAAGFLQRSGIADLSIARSIAARVGGNPLTLKLAADLVLKYGSSELSTSDFTKKRHYFFDERLPEVEIQGILYRRILKHIHDPRVRSLANPGLVLRHITSDLILHVLAGPCKLEISTNEEAEQLFTLLNREVSLVTSVTPNVIRHRPDVRKVMLGLMARENPSIVEQIHRAAIEYYSLKDGIANRAEEFYHRLCLEESPRLLDSRWIEGIQNYLLGTFDELPPKSMAFLSAKTGIESDDLSIWEAADIEDAERRIIRMTAGLLNSGEAERVIEMIDEAGTKTTRTGRMQLIKVLALEQLGRTDEAIHLATNTLESFYSDELHPTVRIELAKVVSRNNGSDSYGESRRENNAGEESESGFEVTL